MAQESSSSFCSEILLQQSSSQGVFSIAPTFFVSILSHQP